MATTKTNVNDEGTICAISTPPGEGGIGIVRLSGPEAISIADSIFRSPGGVTLGSVRSRRLVYGHIVKDGQNADEVLVSVMHAPHTYTREDIVEINCHSGIAALRAVLDRALERGARMAHPGEFTKRAFLNGRIDLTQAEAVLDIVKARTEEALTAAVARADGGLSGEVLSVRDRLVGVLAHLEASIDFPQEDINPFITSEATAAVESSLKRIGALIEESWRGMLYREGIAVAITGKPNVGKSCLFNALLRRARAIVTRHPGTTRDLIEETLNIDGVPVRLSDSAGVRASDDEVEQIGLRVADRSVMEAQIVLFVLDHSEPFSSDDEMVCARIEGHGKETIIVTNKIDLPAGMEPSSLERISQKLNDARIVATSATERAGIEDLEKAISDIVFKGRASSPTQAIVARAHQRDSLRKTEASLRTFLEAAQAAMPAECLAIDLREAIQSLGEIVGEVTTEDILDRIFSEFCIGK